MTKMTMVQALNLALRQEMAKDDSVVVLGEDVGVDGGVFRVTDGLIGEFGEERVIDTPLAEGAIAAAGVGMAVYGLRPCLRDPVLGVRVPCLPPDRVPGIENPAALPGALRGPHGRAHALRGRRAGARAPLGEPRGPLCASSRPQDGHPLGARVARALLVSAIRDPDPVILYEPTALYRAYREDVPEEEEVIPIGESRVAREGSHVTLIAYGAMLRQALAAADELHEKDGIEAEVIDLMTIAPLDDAKFVESAKKTGKVVVIHESPRSFGPGAEIVARRREGLFQPGGPHPPHHRLRHHLSALQPGACLYSERHPHRPRGARNGTVLKGESAMNQEFRLPDLGEGIHEGEVTKVLVKVGEGLRRGTPSSRSGAG